MWPRTVVLQTTLMPELSGSAAPRALPMTMSPSIVEPATRMPVPLTRRSPATEVSIMSHQSPGGTVTLPCTMAALSCSSSQLTLPDDGIVTVARSGRRDSESASPT